ncbi:MAG: histidine triad nucleotide-binding protein [Candidatus Eremiobacteraeota bacterium]|nr:histidine triad nucleotide-binding protein [Candidatus Eremiobacteraeota bacterium]
MVECLFCKIAEKEIPADIIYEDDMVIAFHDINPQAPKHVLIIPRKHISTLLEITPEDREIFGHIFNIIPEVVKMIGGEKGFRIVANCLEPAGQSVFHIHFHLLAGRNFGWPPG